MVRLAYTIGLFQDETTRWRFEATNDVYMALSCSAVCETNTDLLITQTTRTVKPLQLLEATSQRLFSLKPKLCSEPVFF